MKTPSPVGIFDSGVGGLTIYRELAALLPHEQFIYLGDTARVPYGNKSGETVIRYSLEIARFLLKQEIKLLIVACHTAASHSLEILQKTLPIPVIGVIQPGFELLMQTTRSQRIAILGTRSTLHSGVYQALIRDHYPSAHLFPIPCPLFVPLAEESLFHHDAALALANHYLAPLRTQHIDAALLACTHYPLLRPAIQEALGPQVKLLESGPCCAEQARQLLDKAGLLNPQTQTPPSRFFVTDDPERFAALANIFLGRNVPNVELVSLEA